MSNVLCAAIAWRRLRLLALRGLVCLLPAGTPTTSEAAEPPKCAGRDLLPAMLQSDPRFRSWLDEASVKVPHGRAVLWRVENRSGGVSHLFGTIHTTDERVHRLPVPVAQALDGARVVALEIADISPKAVAAGMAGMGQALVFVDGRRLSGVLTGSEMEQARIAAEKAGLPGAAVPMLRPWVITMALAIPDCERRRMQAGLQALDLMLGDRARARNVPVKGLETVGDQLSAFARVPEGDQVVILKATLAVLDRTEDAIETLIQRYLARDLGAIWSVQERLWRDAGFSAGVFQSFKRELLTKRNERMLQAALPMLEAGGAFIAVGALHLPGEDGLVALVEKAGYRVQAVH